MHGPAITSRPSLSSQTWPAVGRRRRTQIVAAAAVLITSVALAAPNAEAAGADDDLTAWVPTGEFASSSLERVPQVPSGEPVAAPASVTWHAVRGAEHAAQLAVTAHDDLSDLAASVNPQRGARGVRPLPEEWLTVTYPEYIPMAGGDAVADPLADGPVDVEAGHQQAIWFTLDVPRDGRAGTYAAQVSITSDESVHREIDLVVEVSSVQVADPTEDQMYLNMWFQPDAVAYGHGVEPYSEEHWHLLDAYLADMASRGQDVINAAIIEDPWEIGWPDGTWRAQTYYPFHTLVDWAYDGTEWSFDYGDFDRYVEASQRAGIGPDIRVYALLMFGGRERLYYTDTRTGEVVREVVDLGDERWREAWSAFLADFGDHLRERGWFDDTMLAFDERPAATMAVAQDFLATEAPEFADKIHIAVYTTDVDLDLPDISFAHGMLPELSEDYLQERRRDGLRTTFYTTGAPLTPNTITATPPIGARMLGWIPAQRGLDGYLRWSYNSWPSDDPFTEPAYRYAQGDEYIVYPGNNGPMSSIRWETFRDGVVDHELVRQLAHRAGEHNAVVQQALAMVDTDAMPSAEAYRSVVEARQMVVDELERLDGAAVTVTPSEVTAVAGQTFVVDVEVANTDGKVPMVRVDTSLVVPRTWQVQTVAGGSVNRILPGEKHTSSFEVTVPTTAPRDLVELTSRVDFRWLGRSVTVESPVPTEVQALVGVTEVIVDPVEPAAGEPVSVTATVTNRGEEQAAATIAVPNLPGWSVEPTSREVVLAPGEGSEMLFVLTPTTAQSGRHDIGVTSVIDGVVVDRSSAPVYYDEAAMTDVTIHSVSSEELVGEDGAASNLVDGDPLTIWHSRWFGEVAGPPHEVVLDLGLVRSVHAMQYLPRQTGTLNGTVKDYEVYVGTDADGWGEPVATGAFAGGREVSRIDFAPIEGRYVRFVMLSEQSGQQFASGAELTPIGAATG